LRWHVDNTQLMHYSHHAAEELSNVPASLRVPSWKTVLVNDRVCRLTRIRLRIQSDKMT